VTPFASLAALIAIAISGGITAQVSCGKSPAQASSSQSTAFNPLRASHDVEVGKFYMDRGDFDGAIARFKDALVYKKNFAEPLRLLGEAYEKKSDPETALHYYNEYLKILPKSSESKKIRERVAKIKDKLKKEDTSAAKN
jgi:tetratricopeptide (TPR) repeat protein